MTELRAACVICAPLNTYGGCKLLVVCCLGPGGWLGWPAHATAYTTYVLQFMITNWLEKRDPCHKHARAAQPHNRPAVIVCAVPPIPLPQPELLAQHSAASHCAASFLSTTAYCFAGAGFGAAASAPGAAAGAPGAGRGGGCTGYIGTASAGLSTLLGLRYASRWCRMSRRGPAGIFASARALSFHNMIVLSVSLPFFRLFAYLSRPSVCGHGAGRTIANKTG